MNKYLVHTPFLDLKVLSTTMNRFTLFSHFLLNQAYLSLKYILCLPCMSLTLKGITSAGI